MSIELRCGAWQDVLRDVECDQLTSDPPYGKETHEATNEHIAGSLLPDGADRLSIAYQHWTAEDVHRFVEHWGPRTRGWMCCFTSDDLIPAWKEAFRSVGRYYFAPLPAIPVIQKRPRLLGDGPASWTVHLMTARPSNREFATWGCLPGAYFSHTERGGLVAGAKPISLMREILRDYSAPGDLVCDPCAGSASTLISAAMEGRSAIGAELDPVTYAKAQARISTMPLETPAGQLPMFEMPR